MYYIPTNAFGLGRIDEGLVPLYLFSTYKYLYAVSFYLLAADTLRAWPVEEWGAEKLPMK